MSKKSPQQVTRPMVYTLNGRLKLLSSDKAIRP